MSKTINLKDINDDNYIKLSRPMIRVLDDFAGGGGLETAVMLCELIAEYAYWSSKGMIPNDNYFYSTVANVEEKTCLSKHKQLNAVKILTDFGVIRCQQRGIPAKRYFKFDELGVKRLRDAMSKYTDEKPAEQQAAKPAVQVSDQYSF